MDLAKAKDVVGDRICLIGNLDVSRLLVDADKEEVYEAVRLAIHDAGHGGGFILAPDHSHPGISVERLRWMLEAAELFGRYPLEV
jgi:uroporphyrinogen decarboxylase